MSKGELIKKLEKRFNKIIDNTQFIDAFVFAQEAYEFIEKRERQARREVVECIKNSIIWCNDPNCNTCPFLITGDSIIDKCNEILEANKE